jgi:hypothetical protein
MATPTDEDRAVAQTVAAGYWCRGGRLVDHLAQALADHAAQAVADERERCLAIVDDYYAPDNLWAARMRADLAALMPDHGA